MELNDGLPFCVTLEPGNMDNERNISCIPSGRYILRPYKSQRHPKTWEVFRVPNRSKILFHAGNELKNTEGCIIVAKNYGKLNENWAALNSGNTFKSFISKLNGEKECELTITESY